MENIARTLTFFQNEVIISRVMIRHGKCLTLLGDPKIVWIQGIKGKCCVWQHWEGSFQTLTLGSVLIKSLSCYVLKSIMPFVPKTLFPQVAPSQKLSTRMLWWQLTLKGKMTKQCASLK